MWKIEILLYFMISLAFVFPVKGYFDAQFMRGQARYTELEKQMNLDGIVKLAKTHNGEDIICVDVYKQPAFKNPLLKNHKLQWKPITIPNNFKDGVLSNRAKNVNSGSQNSLCPAYTIPIRKTHVKSFNDLTRNDENNSLIYRFALLKLIHYPDDVFYGASAQMKFDNPHCENGQNSGASIWIASDNSEKRNVIKAGWMDISTRHWWLLALDAYTLKLFYIGYWPKELFTRFDQGATVLNFGGSTMTHLSQQFPPMGDGYFPDGHIADSNYFGKIEYVNKTNYVVPPSLSGATIHTDNSNCYGIIYQENEGDKSGHHLFVGGPGGQC